TAEPRGSVALRRRLLRRLGSGGPLRGGRPLARRRPGRQRPYTGRLLWRGRREGDPRARPLLGRDAHRPHDRLRDAARANGRRRQGGLLAQQIKAWLLADAFVHDRFLGIPYARLHNARLALRRAIADALGSRDLLLMPTMPMTAPKLADAGTPFAEVSMRTAA